MNLIPFSRYKITGHSMNPTLKEGQLVLVFNWAYLFSKPKEGEIIVFKFGKKEFVKRVVSFDGKDLRVKGDNAKDSLDVGLVPLKNLIGKVVSY